MPHKYRVGERVRIKNSPYPAAVENGQLGTVTRVTELAGETYTVYVLPDLASQRSITRKDGSWCLYPHEVEPAPANAPFVPKVANLMARTTAHGVVASKAPSIDNLPRAKKKRSKWETPGNHNITSYRSFRRYKAAGAAFGVVVFNPNTGQPEPAPVPVSVRLARFRAQAGMSLVAIVSEVNA